MESVLGFIVLIVVLYIAFHIGAIILRILLGLFAIGILAWLIMGLLGGPPPV